MPFTSRFIALVSTLAVVVVGAFLWAISPIHISVSFDRSDSAAAAAPARSIDTTATPAPPTATPEPTATDAPSVPAILPTNTSVPATSTLPATATVIASPQPTAQLPAATPRTSSRNDPTPEPTATVSVSPTATQQPEQPHVSIVKDANPATVKPGETVVFRLVARNTGSSTARDVIVSDVVPDVFQVTDLQSTKGDVVVDGQSVTAYPSTLAPNETVTIRITAKVQKGVAAGPYRNTALITTSTVNDNPADNTSTTVVIVQAPPAYEQQAPPAQKPPVQKQAPPPDLPKTADPDAPTWLMIYGPWMMLALFLAMFGCMVRVGMFRTRFVRVTLTPFQGLTFPSRGSNAAMALLEHKPQPGDTSMLAAGMELDSQMLVERWQSGMSVVHLVNEIAAENPHANRLLISLTVQHIIDEELKK